MDFTSKVVLVTGAASGIGAATAVDFARLGAQLAIADRDENQLKKVAANVKKMSSNCVAPPLELKVDLKNDKEVQSIFEQVICEFEKLDVLVNCAGIMELGSLDTTNLEQFDRTMHTNLRPIYQLTLLAMPHLIKSKGSIVNISSVCGLRVFPNVIAYNTSKAGVDHFTRSVALELGTRGVRCNAINPGAVVTNLQKSGGMDEKTYKEFLERGKQTHALGRVGQPHEISAVVCFLASELSSFITGVTLSVDGGKQLLCPR